VEALANVQTNKLQDFFPKKKRLRMLEEVVGRCE